MEGCHVSRWWTCFWTIVSWRLCKIFRVCLTVFCCVHVRCILRCRSAGPLFRGAARLEFCLNPKGERSTFVWEHVALNPRVFFLGCDLFVVLLVFFCVGVCFCFLFFVVVFRIRPGFRGRGVWRWPSGSRLRRPKQAGFLRFFLLRLWLLCFLVAVEVIAEF